ncbi:MAG: Asp-tRNA(Asn)/Glu-tRNA(Gln) amidotransferase subunit GatB [Chloroflexi bacterium]|nr:Asp-tRNA(Asn)/Glu-tRNA(Gln) amidotransferase subunit GatB [Chloroflexota bacterium]
MEYETVIGLEVHAELSTESKLFCGCANRFGAPPNSLVCPVCLGLPGVLPVVNRKAVEYIVLVGLAVGGEIASYSKFDRKNYFYPDMPKNFQISQYDLPLCDGGTVRIELDGLKKDIRLKRVHLEEDTGKSVHGGTIDSSDFTLEDYNRAGVPLMEIVSEPDMRSPAEAHAYMEELHRLLRWLGVSDCKMEEGSLRCDANISVRSKGETALGVKTEIKNMNSFRSVEAALACEEKRQIEILENGGEVLQETRGWNEDRCITFLMRSKEEVQEYRYFPEPDLVPIRVEPEKIESIRAGLPELPFDRQARYMEQYNLEADTAKALVQSRYFSDFFDRCILTYKEARAVVNWLLGDVSKFLNENNIELEKTGVTPQSLVEMIRLIDDGKLSGKIAKEILPEMMKSGEPPAAIAQKMGLSQESDESRILEWVLEALRESPDAVAEYRRGKEKALGFIVGQVMKKSRGQANPGIVNKLIKQELDKS